MEPLRTACDAPGIACFLNDDPEAELGTGVRNATMVERLTTLNLDAAFAPNRLADRAMARACHSGLWLLANDLDASHTLSQSIETPTGSFWHAIMHRREGDFSNAKYWFRRVGSNPLFPRIAAAAHAIDRDLFPSTDTWYPSAMVDRCEAIAQGALTHAPTLRKVARQEWELLFTFCYRHAIGADA